jgi:hypothetical protein
MFGLLEWNVYFRLYFHTNICMCVCVCDLGFWRFAESAAFSCSDKWLSHVYFSSLLGFTFFPCSFTSVQKFLKIDRHTVSMLLPVIVLLFLSVKLSFFLSLQTRNQLTCYVKTSCFHFEKVGDHSNESDTNVKTSWSRHFGESVKTSCTVYAPSDLLNSLLWQCTRDFNHPVYSVGLDSKFYTKTSSRIYVYKYIIIRLYSPIRTLVFTGLYF